MLGGPSFCPILLVFSPFYFDGDFGPNHIAVAVSVARRTGELRGNDQRSCHERVAHQAANPACQFLMDPLSAWPRRYIDCCLMSDV